MTDLEPRRAAQQPDATARRAHATDVATPVAERGEALGSEATARPADATTEAAAAARRDAREARDRAQFILGALSLVIWLVAAFGLSVAWFVDEYTARPVLMAGGIALLLAALPWLGYARLVRRLQR